MNDNIIDLKQYRETLEKNEDRNNLWSEASDEKLMKLYNDIMNSDDDIDSVIEESSNHFTRATVNELYEIGADPVQQELSQDVVLITMLYQAAIDEYFKGKYAMSDGVENPMYRFLNIMKKSARINKP